MVHTFKDQAVLDNEVFFDTVEFADEIEWCGARQWYDESIGGFRPITAVIGSDEHSGLPQEGVFGKETLVFIPAECIDAPVPDQEVTLNGERYIVRACENVGGTLEIELFAVGA